MKKLLAVATLAGAATLTFADNASALEPSTKGPFYVQATPLGVGLASFCAGGPFGGCATGGAYHLDFEVGMHFLGHHDGPVAGLRQAFYIAGASIGTTQARLGWDIAIPISDFELTIAPYGTFGIGYGFNGGDPLFAFGIGAEGKFFFWKGLYGFFRPFEGGALIGNASGFLANFLVAGIGFAPDF